MLVVVAVQEKAIQAGNLAGDERLGWVFTRREEQEKWTEGGEMYQALGLLDECEVLSFIQSTIFGPCYWIC